MLLFSVQDLPGGGIKDGTSVEVEDYSQDITVKLIVFQKTFDEEEVRHRTLIHACPLRSPPPLPRNRRSFTLKDITTVDSINSATVAQSCRPQVRALCPVLAVGS